MLNRDRGFQGTAEACAVATFGSEANVEEISLLEHRVDWDNEGFRGYATDVTLRSGMELCISETRSEKLLTLPVDGCPTALTISLSRGTGLTTNVGSGLCYVAGGGTLEVSQVHRQVEMTSTLSPGAHNEFVVLHVEPDVMCQLVGVQVLPKLVQNVVDSDQPFARACVPMGGELFRLLDELLHCAAAGLSRQLYLEGKALEILARVFDELDAESSAPAFVLNPADVARLHRVRKALLERLDATPSLEDLSREAGLNQTKLKADFRTLFGSPIFSYLRDVRMTEAHRLLGEGELNVTEIASRVGYANPSKFASAFRRHFGQAPSFVRNAKGARVGA